MSEGQKIAFMVVREGGGRQADEERRIVTRYGLTQFFRVPLLPAQQDHNLHITLRSNFGRNNGKKLDHKKILALPTKRRPIWVGDCTYQDSFDVEAGNTCY